MDETYQRPKGGRFEHPAWEQQSYETDAAFLGFECYRDLGRGRTLEQAWRLYKERQGAQKATKGPSWQSRPSGSFRRWSQDNLWPQRVRLYDQHEDAIKREEHEKVLRETSRRYAAEAQAYMAAILPVARSVLRSFTPEEREASEAELARMPIAKRLTLAARLARAFPPLMEAERLARGVPDGPIVETIPEEEPAVNEHEATRSLIHRILQDPDACDRAAWSVLDEDEETDNDPEEGGS